MRLEHAGIHSVTRPLSAASLPFLRIAHLAVSGRQILPGALLERTPDDDLADGVAGLEVDEGGGCLSLIHI